MSFETIKDAGSGGRPRIKTRDQLGMAIVACPLPELVGEVSTLSAAPTVIARLERGERFDGWMSRRHATVRASRDGKAAIVRDGAQAEGGGWAHSSNGTWVGETHLDEDTRLTPGRTFRTGHTLWMVVNNPSEREPASALAGISAGIGHARTELELVTSQVALRLDRGQRVTQALLVTGPRGTGKQVVAREAQRLLSEKRRREVPFRQVAGPALGDGTAAADLFGVVDRYATDVRARPGYFEQAHGGIVFFDEVADTPPSEQAKLLTALQEREVVRLGGTRAVPFDCLVVAATNRDLMKMTHAGAFRADLLDRLGRFVVNLPALDDRKEDIGPLATTLVERHGFQGTLTWDAVLRLIERRWPGNVRELDACLDRAVALAQVEGAEDLDLEIIERALASVPAPPPLAATGAVARPIAARSADSPGRTTPPREELLRHLEETGWNKTEVGRRYGKHPRQVTRWMQYLEIERPK